MATSGTGAGHRCVGHASHPAGVPGIRTGRRGTARADATVVVTAGREDAASLAPGVAASTARPPTVDGATERDHAGSTWAGVERPSAEPVG